jgi:hypothetical protein
MHGIVVPFALFIMKGGSDYGKGGEMVETRPTQSMRPLPVPYFELEQDTLRTGTFCSLITEIQ